jgi:Cys-rich four helix bundle protein (predicted Tat secretion target)
MKESPIHRRELLLVGAGAVMAKALTVTTACAGNNADKRAPNDMAPPPRAEGAAAGDFAAIVAECTRVGQICMQHCLSLLASGDTSMAACAKTVHEMLAVCRGTEVLALAGSSHLAQAAGLCKAVCESCEAACKVHAGHHRECGDCATACRATIDAAASLA